MTTIAYKDGVLAFDSRMTDDTMDVIGTIKKGLKTPNWLCAICGDARRIPEFLNWVSHDFKPKYKPKWKVKADDDFEAVCINKQGQIFIYETELIPMEIDLEKNAVYATGSGSKYALGAMHAGATAKQAIIAAAAYDGCTGGRIREITFKEDTNGKETTP